MSISTVQFQEHPNSEVARRLGTGTPRATAANHRKEAADWSGTAGDGSGGGPAIEIKWENSITILHPVPVRAAPSVPCGRPTVRVAPFVPFGGAHPCRVNIFCLPGLPPIQQILRPYWPMQTYQPVRKDANNSSANTTSMCSRPNITPSKNASSQCAQRTRKPASGTPLFPTRYRRLGQNCNCSFQKPLRDQKQSPSGSKKPPGRISFQ